MRSRFLLLALCACSTSSPSGSTPLPGSQDDAGSDSKDADVAVDAGPAERDSGGRDSGADGGIRDAASDAPYPHKYGDAGVNAPCELNRDCARGLRCECNGDCFCKTGARGNGGIGAPCTTGEDCGSSICINDKTCSDECTNAAQCMPAFTKCLAGPFSSVKICAP